MSRKQLTFIDPFTNNKEVDKGIFNIFSFFSGATSKPRLTFLDITAILIKLLSDTVHLPSHGGWYLFCTFIIPSANVKNQQELVNKLDYCLLCSIVCAAVQNIAQRCPLCEVLQLNSEILVNNKNKRYVRLPTTAHLDLKSRRASLPRFQIGAVTV